MFDNDDLVIKYALPLDVYFSLRRHNIIMRNIRCLDQKEGPAVRDLTSTGQEPYTLIPQIDLEPVDTPIIELVTENVGIGGSFGSVLQGRVVNNTNETVSEAEVSALFFDSNDEVVEVSVDTFF